MMILSKMEWQLPIQKVELSNIHISSPWATKQMQTNGAAQGGGAYYPLKPLAPLSYFGPQFRLPFITILFSPFPIVEYNSNTGKLVLDMSSTSLACKKLSTFQETLINAIEYHQTSWFRTSFTKEEINLQPIFESEQLFLHCPMNARNIPLWKNGAWQTSITPEDLKPGTRIRVAIKIHGISFLTRPEDDTKWTGKCRLQHRIQGIILQN